jgi:methanogenic corrinoid protein MtbC1
MGVMNRNTESPRPSHPIQVAARRSGLSADVIRVWERRYGAVDPERTSTNRRLYTDEDIEKLLLLGRVTKAGRRIGDVAALTLEQLRSMVSEDRSAAARVGTSSVGKTDSGTEHRHLARCLDALQALDAEGLEAALADASIALPGPALVERLLGPFMKTVGDQWQTGEMRVAHEHVATAIVRSFLGAARNTAAPSPTAPELIVATPAGQSHELGALSVSIAASADGWRVTYLGADLPAEDVAAVARTKNAKAVALSIVYPADDPRLRGELRKLRARLDGETALIVGGPSAGAYLDVLEEIGAIVVPNIETLRSELQSVRYGSASD